jgi:hypothetical protein
MVMIWSTLVGNLFGCGVCGAAQYPSLGETNYFNFSSVFNYFIITTVVERREDWSDQTSLPIIDLN